MSKYRDIDHKDSIADLGWIKLHAQDLIASCADSDAKLRRIIEMADNVYRRLKSDD